MRVDWLRKQFWIGRLSRPRFRVSLFLFFFFFSFCQVGLPLARRLWGPLHALGITNLASTVSSRSIRENFKADSSRLKQPFVLRTSYDSTRSVGVMAGVVGVSPALKVQKTAVKSSPATKIINRNGVFPQSPSSKVLQARFPSGRYEPDGGGEQNERSNSVVRAYRYSNLTAFEMTKPSAAT